MGLRRAQRLLRRSTAAPQPEVISIDLFSLFAFNFKLLPVRLQRRCQ